MININNRRQRNAPHFTLELIEACQREEAFKDEDTLGVLSSVKRQAKQGDVTTFAELCLKVRKLKKQRLSRRLVFVAI